MKDSFFDLSKAVWQLLLDQHKTGKPLLTIQRRKANWTEVGLVVTSPHEYNMIEFLRRHMSLIRKIPEFEVCIEVMKNDNAVSNHLEKTVGGFTNASILQTPMVVESFLIHLMSELKGLNLEDSTFMKAYQTMEDFFYTDSIGVEIFVHLEGFISEAEKLDLGDGWEISRIPQTHFDDLLTEGLLEETPGMSRYGLYWKLEAPKVVLNNNEEFDSPIEYQNYGNTVRRIVTTLRLFKSGDIGFRRIIKRYKGWLSQRGGSSTSFMKPFWGQYSLEATELEDFKSLFNMMSEIPENPAFELALKRLNDAVERQQAYDTIIDIMIAFEALFSYKEEFGKKSVVPKRIATIIHKNTSEWDSIVEDMELAYDLRNSIAHGDTESEIREVFKEIGQSGRDFSSLIANYLRRAMKGYLVHLSKGNDKEDIIKNLEEKKREIEKSVRQ